MKTQTVLYYRYLMKQSLIVSVVSFVLSLIICLVFLFVNTFSFVVAKYLVAGLIWLLPIYTFSFSLTWFIKYKKTKEKMNEPELLNWIKDANVRDRVLKSGVRIKYLIPKKDQEKKFFDAIQPEIEKQRKLFLISKGEYK